MNMFKPTIAKSVDEYIQMIDEPRRSEFKKVFQVLQKSLKGEKPFLISGFIGFVPYHYKSKSGREGDWFVVGIANQKNYISVYICASDGDQYIAEKYRDRLPKANIGKSCIRFKKVDDVDLDVLGKLASEGVEWAKKYMINITDI